MNNIDSNKNVILEIKCSNCQILVYVTYDTFIFNIKFISEKGSVVVTYQHIHVYSKE